jgi:NAD(P)-dependent dehydrogenase (short-subunit alcohol dehydrogenase family)
MQATRALDLDVVARDPAHMGEQKQAVVVGALPVIGRYIVERLLRQEDWSVVVCRAVLPTPRRATAISVSI